MNLQQPDKALLDAQYYTLVKMSDKSLLRSKMRELVGLGFDVHSIYDGHTTGIHIASEYGNVELVRLLLEEHAAHKDVTRGDRVDKDTAFHSAAIGGNFEVLSLLLSFEGAVGNSNHVQNGYLQTPLHCAMGKGRLGMARRLIERGADLESRDWTGASLLHFAARNGSIGGLKLLKFQYHSRGMVMNVNQSSTAGLTALHYAAWNGKDRAIDWLLTEGSNLEKADYVEENTALHWAAMRGHRVTVEKLVKALVCKGVEVFKENREKKTALELIEQYAPIEEVHALLQLVEQQGLLDMKAFPRMVLVKYVMGYGDSKMIQKLDRSLEYAGDKSNHYKASLTQLLREKLVIWLAKRGNKDSVPLLMKLEQYLPDGFLPTTAAAALNDALLNKKTDFAYSLARQGKEKEKEKEKLSEWLKFMKVHLTTSAESLVSKLNKKDQDIFASDDLVKELRQEIPLAFWIFQDGRPDIAKLIELQNAWGPFINEQGPRTGRTALHWAYIFDREDIATKLSEVKECRTDIRDSERKTPIRYAVARRKEERQVFVDALNAIVVGAALIASISFGGLVQPPRGYSKTGRVDLSSAGMKVFWPSNTLSFFFAMASALVALRGVLPMPDIQLEKVVFSIQRALLVSSSLLVGSITFALVAFAAAGLELPSPTQLKMYMIVPTCAGGVTCFLVLLWFLKGLQLLWYPRNEKTEEPADRTSDASLEAEPDVSADPVRELKYKVGPRYSEYPWEDGLDDICWTYKGNSIP